ncbi:MULTISPECIES: acetoacetate decarboxylase [unclassified Vibrio]|uniref:acetoacetate decarboxylase n=1 Tax=unclassified Vibrio TaxID=2614977 RepID=UPI000C852048|nr:MULTISPECIES: acetoacetate decarboxylase [unclassified Vibrio]PMI92563.1 acetoacetate decarboxylase [Vibrio sp. 10N.286.45.E10]PTQ23621.1 acetoacetate decarboxylase [Vibrio sp. 10N.286.46.E10]
MTHNTSFPFGMPVQQGNPAYTVAPNRFVNREYFIITYETEPEALERVLPPGLEAPHAIVKYEFMRMPDSSGFGCFQESGQVIPITFEGKPGSYVHSMFLDCHPPIAAGREIWGFPKKLGSPNLEVDGDTLLGTLDYGKIRIAMGTMGFKYQELDKARVQEELGGPNFLVKSIPDVNGSPAICQLVRYYMTDINVKWAYMGPGALELHAHAMAPVNALPVKRVISASHFVADLTLPYGEVVIDYLENAVL